MRAGDLPRSGGFTLLEVTITIAILGVLTALVASVAVGYLADARNTRAQRDVTSIRDAIHQLVRDTGRAPFGQQLLPGCVAGLGAVYDSTQLNGVDAGLVLADPNTYPAPPACQQNCWRGPYLTNVVGNDPWGSPYQLDLCYGTPPTPGVLGGVAVVSWGPDQLPRTGDDLVALLTPVGPPNTNFPGGGSPGSASGPPGFGE